MKAAAPIKRAFNFGSVAAIVVCAAALAAAPAAPANAPAAATSPARLKAGQTLPLDAILENYSDRFDIIFVKPGPMTDPVTLLDDVPADVDKAIAVLNDALSQKSLTTLRVHRNPGPGEAPSPRILLQIMSIKDARAKQLEQSPVSSGIDPGKIDVTQRDRLITHIVPISNNELLNQVKRAASDEKDVNVVVTGTAADGYQLILSGPALSVRRALSSVVAIDKPTEKVTPVTRSLHVENMDAEASAETVNQLYGPKILGDKGVHAVADRRTNTVIFTGPEAEVLHAMGDLMLQDKGPLPPPLPPPAPLPRPRM